MSEGLKSVSEWVFWYVILSGSLISMRFLERMELVYLQTSRGLRRPVTSSYALEHGHDATRVHARYPSPALTQSLHQFFLTSHTFVSVRQQRVESYRTPRTSVHRQQDWPSVHRQQDRPSIWTMTVLCTAYISVPIPLRRAEIDWWHGCLHPSTFHG